MSKRRAEDVIPTPKKYFTRAMNDATGKRGAKPKHGKEEAPLASRSVSNYELRRLGFWKSVEDK